MYSLCKCVVILISSMLCVQVHAQTVDTWPSQPVNIIAPIDAGSGHDVLTRRLATELAGIWKQPVRVVNLPGASGVIGTQSVINSAPDGHTLGMVSATFTGTLAAKPQTSFQREKLTGVIKVARQNFIIFVNSSSPFDNVTQMIAYAKSNPGKLTYASPGVASYVHLTLEHLGHVQHLNMVHVPYRGIMQAAPDVVSGRVPIMITVSNPSLEGLVAKGDLKVIGSISESATYQGNSVQSLPDVVPGVEAHGYYAIVVPQGVSRTIIDKIQKDVAGVLSQPEFRQTMLSLGMPPDTSISKNFDGWIDLEVARLRKIIIRAKLQID